MARLGHLTDVWCDVLNGLAARPGRAVLLVLVFALGSGGFVAALGISQTAAAQVTQRLTPSDLDEVRLRPVIAQERGETLVEALPATAETRARSIPGVIAAGVVWEVSGDSASVTLRPSAPGSPALAGAPHVIGTDAAWLGVAEASTSPTGASWQLDAGPAAGHTALVGDAAAKTLGLAGAGPGEALWIGGRKFEVIGIIHTSPRAKDLKTAVVVSSLAAQRIGRGSARPGLVVRTLPGYAKAVSDALATTVRPERPGSLTVDPVVDLLHLRRGIATDLDRIVALGSGLVLVLAGMAIANAMLVSALTRRGEIGLRRAMGSSRRQIAELFLMEGAVVGLAGGILGIACGLLAIVTVAWTRSWTPVMSTGLLPVGLISASTVGLLFATYPAWHASRIQPAEAVRHQG